MPVLAGGMARTGAVVGAATTTRNAVNCGQARKSVAAYVETYTQAAAPPQQAAPSPASQEEGVITQLARLGNLHVQGGLTDEEFAAQKAKLLGNRACRAIGLSSHSVNAHC